ncbi:CHAT domain-containing protein [Actinoplanes sp. CA-252034]|uniref:CHAT domain-containing protein n=1 Tax=Actinoplanes sp. CA-252034 TaxID=3239906 RepID=UPI003D997F76
MIIVPDPRLWHLPHAALLRDGVRLIDVAEVTLAPSLRTLELLLRRPVTSVPLPGRPVLSDLDATLPGHAVERAALDGWPGGHDLLSGLAASRRDAAAIYVSGHGAAAGATPRFGRRGISLDSLASAELPRLVLLNGCWSGTAVSRYGRDPLSLAVGALIGGADTVIAGVGRVGSEASAHIGAAIIRLCGNGLRPTAALRIAQRNLRDEHPELGLFDWAGLCAVGLGR